MCRLLQFGTYKSKGHFSGVLCLTSFFSKNVSRFVEVIVERRTKKTFAVLAFFCVWYNVCSHFFYTVHIKKRFSGKSRSGKKKIHLEYIERVRERETGKYYASFSPNISNTTEEMEEGRKKLGKRGHGFKLIILLYKIRQPGFFPHPTPFGSGLLHRTNSTSLALFRKKYFGKKIERNGDIVLREPSVSLLPPFTKDIMQNGCQKKGGGKSVGNSFARSVSSFLLGFPLPFLELNLGVCVGFSSSSSFLFCYITSQLRSLRPGCQAPVHLEHDFPYIIIAIIKCWILNIFSHQLPIYGGGVGVGDCAVAVLCGVEVDEGVQVGGQAGGDGAARL